MIEPEDRWAPWRVDVILTGGPERIYDDNPAPEKRRPVGFVVPDESKEADDEPLLWEGDGA